MCRNESGSIFLLLYIVSTVFEMQVPSQRRLYYDTKEVSSSRFIFSAPNEKSETDCPYCYIYFVINDKRAMKSNLKLEIIHIAE